jgi:hypothetical protein
MRRCIAILLLSLASWAKVAGADEIKTYQLTISIHPAVRPQLKLDEIKDILKGASDILQGHTSITPHNNCKVAFEFKGFVPFPASAPARVTNATELEQVHEVPADVKVVQSITFCVGEARPNGFAGCAWRPENRKRTVIVARDGFLPGLSSPQGGGIGPVLWAHEFGHTTGLIHRYHKGILSDSENLMTPCELEVVSQPINDDECAHFLKGPVPPPYPPGSGPACPKTSSSGRPPD